MTMVPLTFSYHLYFFHISKSLEHDSSQVSGVSKSMIKFEVLNFRKRILTISKPDLVIRNYQWNCILYSIATALGKIIQRFNQSLNLRMFGQVFVGYLGVYLFINALYWSMETIKVIASFFLHIDVFSLVDSELQTQTTIHWCLGIKIFLGNSGKCTWKSLLLTTCFGKATTLNFLRSECHADIFPIT